MQCLEVRRYVIPVIPPSNNKYQGTGGIGANMAYQEEKRRWEAEVKVAVGRDRPKNPYKKALIVLHYYFGDRKRRDPDNYSGKYILDGLVISQVLEDDNFNNIRIFAESYYDKENPRLEIEVIPIDELSEAREIIEKRIDNINHVRNIFTEILEKTPGIGEVTLGKALETYDERTGVSNEA